MVPFRIALAALLIAAAAPAEAVELAQNAPINNAPITNAPNLVLPPDALPDLWLWSPLITATCNANKTVTINLKATFKNIGKSPAKFTAGQTIAKSSYGYESGKTNLADPAITPIQTFPVGPATIAPGASHTVHLSIGPLSRYKPMSKPGAYVASASINPNKSIAETNVHNNGIGGYVNDPCFGK